MDFKDRKLTNDELMHYGVLGMKWGKRKAVDASYAKAHSKKNKLKYMSDNELQSVNRRLNLEKQYKDLTRKKSKGKAAIDTFVKTAGTITAVTAAYGTYKNVLGPVVKKYGKMRLSDFS